MKLTAASIAILTLSMIFFNLAVVQFVMVVPFAVNLYLMLSLFWLWRRAGYGDVYKSELYRATFIHLISWVLLSAVYFIFAA